MSVKYVAIDQPSILPFSGRSAWGFSQEKVPSVKTSVELPIEMRSRVDRYLTHSQVTKAVMMRDALEILCSIPFITLLHIRQAAEKRGVSIGVIVNDAIQNVFGGSENAK